MTSAIDELLDHLRNNETACRDPATKDMPHFASVADDFARWIAAVEEQQEAARLWAASQPTVLLGEPLTVKITPLEEADDGE